MHSNDFADHHFIRSIIEEDLISKRYRTIQTRFPPEPNGYLHIGHVKSICLNFGLAYIYGGACHLRFDDTNPQKESQEYVDAIKEDITWLGFQWLGQARFASDYFQQLYEYAELFIKKGLAYVDDLSVDAMRSYRVTLTEPGKDSPYRQRSITENLQLFRQMKEGVFAEGSKTLRLKLDMASANINMRDPVIYRIRETKHHRTGDHWHIYPMYDYTHCISDAIEGITHSLCTLEFEGHRPLYDWILEQLDIKPRPHQYEFSRLELMYTLTSKRKLQKLILQHDVSGWDDPRLPTVAGMRRRGYTPEGLRLFCKRIGISKSENTVDLSILEGAMREDLEKKVPHMMVVLHPLRVELVNYDAALSESRLIPYHAADTSYGARELMIEPVIYIEQEDFALNPPAKWHRLCLGGEVRLRHSYVIRCEEVVKNANAQVVGLKCVIDYDTLGKKPEGRKVKGVLHWVGEQSSAEVEVRLYDRLFTVQAPDMMRNEAGEFIDFREFINPDSYHKVAARAERSACQLPAESRWQFERLGYFITDRYDHCTQWPVFNRIVALRDTWGTSRDI